MSAEIEALLAATDPWPVFRQWLELAKSSPGIKEPTAMFLATANRNGQATVRTVLLKSFDTASLVFFTNYDSEKGQQLKENAKAELLFYWDPLARQVRVRGEVERTTREESEIYWRSRPLESQLSGSLSKQSRSVEPGVDLLLELERTRAKFPEGTVPCPQNWGGFRLVPKQFEFWIGRSHRLHDRVRLTQIDENWVAQQLYP